ncbi:MAG TPA: DNA polymerase III subunit gamma/tau [Rhizobiales bacterium]|nr:DNA polymerase III subunit gamma/tau [Hyphomicrobiales bacterium]
MSDTSAEYRVLARKYRPSDFSGLIGQDAMVRTLTNAFEQGRIAQAFMLTGVRGVGKTTTARILARALNYTGADGTSGPTVRMEAMGEHCEAIMESRHIDVMEMDAASHTGISDIREIIEAVKYKPASARYKVYIIDEVHMLSTAAFNGLLKTLEEPPEHVKFIFATTEIRKVPVTVLSRCQRFDLRRIDAALLVEHFRAIAKKEEVEVEDEALAMIARAAEGSVRDGLSLLDQAIALGGGRVSGANLRDMLGIADRARVIELFDHVMNGRASEALAELKDQYESGADPAVVLSDMADFIHFVTRLKVTGDAAAQDATMSQTEIERGREMAAGLDMRVLARAWQMSLKGLAEIRAADKPLSAADMLLVRMAYAADMPPPEDLVRQLASQTPSGTGAPARSAPAPQGGPQAQSGAPPASFAPPADQTPDPAPASFEDIVALAGRHRELRLKTALERQVRVVKFEPGRLEIQLADGARKGLPGELTQKLQEWTGARWVVVLSTGSAAPTLEEKRRETEDRQRKEILKRPEVRAVMDTFPGAKVTAVRMREDKDGQDPQTGNTPQTETGA